MGFEGPNRRWFSRAGALPTAPRLPQQEARNTYTGGKRRLERSERAMIQISRNAGGHLWRGPSDHKHAHWK